MPEAERITGEGRCVPKKIGVIEWGHDVCPGWAVRLPIVSEAWRGFAATKAGIFRDAYPSPPRLLVDAVLVAQTYQAEYENDRNRKDKP